MAAFVQLATSHAHTQRIQSSFIFDPLRVAGNPSDWLSHRNNFQSSNSLESINKKQNIYAYYADIMVEESEGPTPLISKATTEYGTEWKFTMYLCKIHLKFYPQIRKVLKKNPVILTHSKIS